MTDNIARSARSSGTTPMLVESLRTTAICYDYSDRPLLRRAAERIEELEKERDELLARSESANMDSEHHPDDNAILYLGGTYETQAGDLVEMVGIENAGSPYETLVDAEGVNRYSRRPGDAGRVTGTAHDYSHAGNIKRPFRIQMLKEVLVGLQPVRVDKQQADTLDVSRLKIGEPCYRCGKVVSAPLSHYCITPKPSRSTNTRNMDLADKIRLAERIAKGCAPTDTPKQIAMYAIDIIGTLSSTSFAWKQMPEDYTPSNYGHQIWPEAAPFTIAYLATDHKWYTLNVPVPVLGNVGTISATAQPPEKL